MNKVKITAYFVRYKFETDMVLLEVSGLPDDFEIEDKKRTTFVYYGSKYIFGSFSLDDYKDDDLD